MGQNTRSSRERAAQMDEENLPPWFGLVARYCSIIFPFFLIAAGLLLLLMLALLALGRIEFGWLNAMLNLMTFFASIGFMAWAVAKYDSCAPGWVGIIIAMLFRFGMPWVLQLLVSRSHAIPQELTSKADALQAVLKSPLLMQQLAGNQDQIHAFTANPSGYAQFAPGVDPGALSALAKAGDALTKLGDPAVKNALIFLPNLFTTIAGLGLFLAVISIIHLAYKYYQVMKNQHVTTQKHHFKYMDTSTKDVTKRSYIPSCWQMSRCRPGVRMTCPNYIDRINCWKRRSGCFCDRELANYLVNSVGSGETSEIVDVQVNSARNDVKHMRDYMGKTAKRPWLVQKKLCFECPIFVEHQEYKYKNLSWISFPVTGVIVAIIFPLFNWAYGEGVSYMEIGLKRLADIKGWSEVINPSASESLANSSFEYVVLAVLVLLLSSYVIGFTETCFLKWKL